MLINKEREREKKNECGLRPDENAEREVLLVISCYVIAKIDKSLNFSSYRQMAYGIVIKCAWMQKMPENFLSRQININATIKEHQNEMKETSARRYM